VTRCAVSSSSTSSGSSAGDLDFEAIYFNTEPAQKYESFANWLEYQAPDYYAESDADVGYATPDAVTLTTGASWPRECNGRRSSFRVSVRTASRRSGTAG